jgi:MFS family permease
MVVCGLLSGLKLASTLALCGDLASRAERDTIFAAFNVAGSIGFLLGPLVGGALAQWTLAWTGQIDYGLVFAVAGGVELLLALAVSTLMRRGRVTRARGETAVVLDLVRG